MGNLALAEFPDHEKTFEMCKPFTELRKDCPISTEIEKPYLNSPENVNPRPCSTSDGNLLKNPLCHHYDRCLNLAVEKKWPQFTCIDCGFKDIQMKMESNASEILGCWRLLSKIFMAKKETTYFLNIKSPHGALIFDRNDGILE